MANCLVTGGAGFIGSHLVEALVSRGHRVRVLDDFSTGRRGNLNAAKDRVEIVEGSVTNSCVVSDAVKEIDWIFHLAALPSVRRSVEDPLATHQVCATGTLCVLDAARRAGVQRLIYAASSSAYGDIPGARRTEDDAIAPISPYGVAKLAGELYCRCFTRTYSLETVRLRFFNIFGPRQDPSNPYTGVIALFIAAMAAGRQPVIYGDGRQSRDFTYVANAVQGLLKAAEARQVAGKVYNIGSGGRTDLLGLIDHLNKLLGSTIKPLFEPARAGDILHSEADISLARKDLGYEPAVSVLEGLRQTLEAHRANPS